MGLSSWKAATATQRRGRRRQSDIPGKLQHEQGLIKRETDTKRAACNPRRSPGPRTATKRLRGERLGYSCNRTTFTQVRKAFFYLAAFVLIEHRRNQIKSEKLGENPTSAPKQRTRAAASPRSRAGEDLRYRGATGILQPRKWMELLFWE